MNAYLFCDKRSLNDATIYYIGIIASCLQKYGYTLKTVHQISDMVSPDLVMTITSKYFVKAKCRFPSVKTIYWSQGVAPEETRMNMHNMRARLRYVYRRIVEPWAINKSDLLFVVSERMLQHYREKYGYHKDSFVVMPCYNLPLSDVFDVSQYSHPSFVYAGNASLWQGVDFMLDVYARVERRIENATLTILTNDKQTFTKKIAERHIKNYEIRYVPVVELQQQLHKHKYGFILRDNHIVNNVATPTKMNSYLASYLIPIFSDAVDDFKKNISLNEFTLMANCPLQADDVASMIVDFENKSIDYAKYKDVVGHVFESHYNDAKYKSRIRIKLQDSVAPEIL